MQNNIENVIKVISSYYNRSDDYKQLLYMSTSHSDPIIQYFHPPNYQSMSTHCNETNNVIHLSNPASTHLRLQQLDYLERSDPFQIYLKQIKQKISNQDLDEEQTALRQIVRIFMNLKNKRLQSVWEMIVSCLSIICLIFHQKKDSKKQNMKVIINYKFINSLLKLDIQSILQQNKHVETSLCYILQLCYENKLFEKGKSRQFITAYKIFSLKLLNNISNNTKTVFNTFKIIQYLQNIKQLQPEDYVKYHLIEKIKNKTMSYHTINPAVYDLSYRLLLNANYVQDAFSLNQNLTVSGVYSENNKIFFKSLSQSLSPIPKFKFDELLKKYLFDGQVRLQSFFYRFLRRQFKNMDAISFIKLLESNLLQTLASRWGQVVSNNQVVDYVSVLISVQNKAKQLMLYQVVKDKILSLLPFLVSHIKYKDDSDDLMNNI